MTNSELFKLHELKGRLQGRKTCLLSDITSSEVLISGLKTEVYQAHFTGQLKVLLRWAEENARLQEEVEQIIKEAENARG